MLSPLKSNFRALKQNSTNTVNSTAPKNTTANTAVTNSNTNNTAAVDNEEGTPMIMLEMEMIPNYDDSGEEYVPEMTTDNADGSEEYVPEMTIDYAESPEEYNLEQASVQPTAPHS